MSRTRRLKPSFFTNEDLAECSPFARLVFAGLWTLADRDGRLEDRPKRIKAQILPYDDENMDALLQELHEKGFIVRYEVENVRIIHVPTFIEHQSPHPKEQSLNLPEPQEKTESREKPRKEISLHDKKFTKINNLPSLYIKDKDTKDKDTRVKANQPQKVTAKLGSHFEATEDQINKLVSEDGPEVFRRRVETINNYCASHGKKYKDYPAAYRTFRAKDLERQHTPNAPPRRLSSAEKAQLELEKYQNADAEIIEMKA